MRVRRRRPVEDPVRRNRLRAGGSRLRRLRHVLQRRDVDVIADERAAAAAVQLQVRAVRLHLLERTEVIRPEQVLRDFRSPQPRQLQDAVGVEGQVAGLVEQPLRPAHVDGVANAGRRTGVDMTVVHVRREHLRRVVDEVVPDHLELAGAIRHGRHDLVLGADLRRVPRREARRNHPRHRPRRAIGGRRVHDARGSLREVVLSHRHGEIELAVVIERGRRIRDGAEAGRIGRGVLIEERQARQARNGCRRTELLPAVRRLGEQDLGCHEVRGKVSPRDVDVAVQVIERDRCALVDRVGFAQLLRRSVERSAAIRRSVVIDARDHLPIRLRGVVQERRPHEVHDGCRDRAGLRHELARVRRVGLLVRESARAGAR